MIQSQERDYIVWQNRAVDFYVAARLLCLQEQGRPAAYCAVTAIELLLKATLVYFDRSFMPADANHNIPKMLRILKNKGPKDKVIEVPEYFFYEQRYQSVSRYPGKPNGLIIPAGFPDDLDKVFVSLIVLVPFQFNSVLVAILSGQPNYKRKLDQLRRRNKWMRILRGHLRPWMRPK